jgi:hypothetical protein
MLFKLNSRYANKLNPDGIYILSAKYGLLNLEQEIDPANLPTYQYHLSTSNKFALYNKYNDNIANTHCMLHYLFASARHKLLTILVLDIDHRTNIYWNIRTKSFHLTILRCRKKQQVNFMLRKTMNRLLTVTLILVCSGCAHMHQSDAEALIDRIKSTYAGCDSFTEDGVLEENGY